MKGIRLIGLLVMLGCSADKASEKLFTDGHSLGQIDQRLKEASGLVTSIINPGLLWTLNDSGNPAEVFLIDDHARIQLVCKLVNVRNRDWEDIAIGGGPEKGKNYLYVADIGDNQAQFDLKYIYRFEEPLWSKAKEQLITRIDTLVLRMPDGPRDAETLLIDPLTNDLFIISKREQFVGLYHAPYPFASDTLLLNKVLTIPMTQIVSGCISADGQEVLLKDYDHIHYWKRSEKESLAQLLARKPIELPYVREPQGEAIGWSRDGTAFYTLSESTKEKNADLIVYRRGK